jgi:carboxylesterase
LADLLAAKGYTVDLPLLPAHGPTPDGNGPARWREWVATVAARHAELRRTCQKVVLIGYSMGGSLAIVEAARRPPAAMVLLAVPTFIDRDWRIGILPVARYFVRWWYPFKDVDFSDPMTRANVLKRAPELDLDDPKVQETIRRTVRIPTQAIDHFFRLTRHARKVIGSIHTPALIVQGRRDRTAVPECAEEIYKGLGSQQKELAWFAESAHQLVNGPEGPAVMERIEEWIAQQVGQPEPIPTG